MNSKPHVHICHAHTERKKWSIKRTKPCLWVGAMKTPMSSKNSTGVSGMVPQVLPGCDSPGHKMRMGTVGERQ